MGIRTVEPLNDEQWEKFMKELNRKATPEEMEMTRKLIELSKGMKTIR